MTSEKKPLSIGRLVPLIVLILGLVLFFAFDLDRYASFAALRENRSLLLGWVDRYSFSAVIPYIFVYAPAVMAPPPLAAGGMLDVSGQTGH